MNDWARKSVQNEFYTKMLKLQKSVNYIGRYYDIITVSKLVFEVIFEITIKVYIIILHNLQSSYILMGLDTALMAFFFFKKTHKNDESVNFIMTL